MNKFVKHLTLILFIGLTWGQIDTIQTKTYDGYPNNTDDRAHTMKPTNDGQIWIG